LLHPGRPVDHHRQWRVRLRLYNRSDQIAYFAIETIDIPQSPIIALTVEKRVGRTIERNG
jgi:hypothetical protein